MAKIYISSTFLDLKDYREKLSRALRRSNHEDISRECYEGENRWSVERRLSTIDSCDLYIGLFAWRYGEVPAENNPQGLSVTEIEYLEALRIQKPCLIFFLSDDAPWPPKYIDRDRTRIERIRNKLQSNHTVEFFRSAEDLVTIVTSAITRLGQQWGYPSPVTLIPEIDLSTYYAVLFKRYRHLDLNTLTPPQKDEYLQLKLRSIFVEQSVREDPPPIELTTELWAKLQNAQDIHPEDLPTGINTEDMERVRQSYFEKPTRPVIDVLSDKTYQHIIVLGNPGSGKSTLARYLLLSLIGEAGEERIRTAFAGYVPILIELRSYAGLSAENKFATFLEFFEFMSRNEGWVISKEPLHHYLKTNGHAVVIFDGLDEIFDPTDREQITKRIADFAVDYPNARVVVTSRIIGYRRTILTDAGFLHFTLQDLNEKQVTQFVDSWYSLAMSDQPEEAAARRERILRSFRTSPSIQQLAGNPMLLTIMAIIGKHQELPRERWKLYDHAASVLLQHWDVNKHLTDLNLHVESIGEEDKKELLRRLAYKMQGADGGLSGNYIYHNELEVEFESYLIERYYNQEPERAKVIAQIMIEQLRSRNFILALYGANLYGFVHRAFLEFFCASAIVLKFEKTREFTIERLEREVFAAHWEDKSWHEVLRLICGMIDEKFAGELIKYLADDINSEWQQKPTNLKLAIECLSEIRNLNVVAEPAKHLLENVCSLFDLDYSNESISFQQLLSTFDIVQSTELVGSNWPNRNILVNWLKNGQPSRYPFPTIIGVFVGTVGKGYKELHELLLDYASHADRTVRSLVAMALSVGWQDDKDTVALLFKLTATDEDISVRGTALHCLARYFQNAPQTLTSLQDWAVNAPHKDVRVGSVNSLGQYFKDDSQTLSLLKKIATDSDEPEVRSAAINTLGHYFKTDPSIPNLLRTYALTDNSEEVQDSAISSLASNFKENVETLTLLRDWAVNSMQSNIRSAAIRGLSSNFKDDLETLPLLLDRASSDPDSSVRNSAILALVRHYKSDSRTLPLVWNIASAHVHAEESTRIQAISSLAERWPDESDTLPLLDSLQGESHPEAIRDAARESGLEVRKHRVAAWIKWLNGGSDESRLMELPTTAKGFPAITVQAVRLENIRAFAEPEVLQLNISDSADSKLRPSTLILGDNATGKTTWLRCIALAALGPETANQVEKRPESYLRHGTNRGLIEVLFNLQLDEVSEPQAIETFCVGLEIRAGENSFRAMSGADLKLGQLNAAERLNVLRRRVDDRFGFLCAYGALRSLADNPNALIPEEAKESHERVVSLFRSSSSLMDPDVLSKMLAGDLSNFRNAPAKKLDDVVRQKMVKGLTELLPEVTGTDSSQNSCMSLHGVPIPLRDLSEGYGSLLALVGHLFRHSLSAQGWESDPTQIFGVLLIDEIDLHLHPDWQRRVLLNLRSVFPNLQIICTTHSAMVAGSISTNSVVLLRREDETIRLLSGEDLPQVKGWPADQILTSILFELPTTRDVKFEALFSSYTELLRKHGPEDPRVQEIGKQVSEARKLGGREMVDAGSNQLLNEVLIERFKSLNEETRKSIIAKARLKLSNGKGRNDQD